MDDYNPYASPTADDTPEEAYNSPEMQARIQAEAKRLLRQQQDKTTSWQLLATGIIGCFSPILAIYGLVFLLRRPYAFPLKGLAIAGTVLHFVWTGLLVLMLLGNMSQ